MASAALMGVKKHAEWENELRQKIKEADINHIRSMLRDIRGRDRSKYLLWSIQAYLKEAPCNYGALGKSPVCPHGPNSSYYPSCQGLCRGLVVKEMAKRSRGKKNIKKCAELAVLAGQIGILDLLVELGYSLGDMPFKTFLAACELDRVNRTSSISDLLKKKGKKTVCVCLSGGYDFEDEDGKEISVYEGEGTYTVYFRRSDPDPINTKVEKNAN